MKKFILLVGLLSASLVSHSQSITKTTSSGVSGTVCPGSTTWYEVSAPGGLTNCDIVWSATNGQVTPDANDQRKASVVWVDTPGASGTVTATFVNCNNEGNNGTTATKSELILSVKNQSWGSYGNSINIDYCTTENVYITVPRMFVQGTGGFGQPASQEVKYAWTLPPGWTTNGSLNTSANFITISPTKCAVPGIVKVEGVIIDRCGSAGLSAPATISLNGANPVVTMGPQVGYTGGSACNTTPVTFYATLNVALGCISSYNWTYPPSWTFVSQNNNSITLQPSGTQADANAIKATVNFGCGSSISSGSYIPPFAAPELSGPDLICTAGSFTINNTGVTPTWSTSYPNGLSITNSGVASRVGNFNGSVTVTAQFICSPNSVTVEKTIWVGKPEIEMISFSNSVDEGWYFCSSASGNTFVLDTKTPSANFQARMLNWPSLTVAYTSPINYYDSGAYEWNYVPIPNNGYYVFEMKGSNVCGPTDWIGFEVEYIDCSGFGEGLFSVYPNPVESSLTIEKVHQNDGKELSYENVKLHPKSITIELFDKDGNLVLSKLGDESLLPFQANTSDLQNGFYTLALTINGRKVFRRIRVAH